MKPLHVAVLMGGPSTEREVSLKSGKMVAAALRQSALKVSEVDVKGPEFALPPGVDVAFIAMHGLFGEDGHVQQILEERGVPYTGSDVAASAVAFDKVKAKELFLEAGIPTPRHVVLDADLSGAVEEMTWPLVVKPARQGSSVGINIVKDRAALEHARDEARKYDGEILVEEFVHGRELTVGILGGRALPVIEIKTEGWFDYKAKYTPGAAIEEVAKLEPAVAQRIQELALRAHECLGCRDVSRVDVMLREDGQAFVLEVNTIPGMTENSLMPKAAASAGISMEILCRRLVEMALARRSEVVAA